MGCVMQLCSLTNVTYNRPPLCVSHMRGSKMVRMTRPQRLGIRLALRQARPTDGAYERNGRMDVN